MINDINQPCLLSLRLCSLLFISSLRFCSSVSLSSLICLNLRSTRRVSSLIYSPMVLMLISLHLYSLFSPNFKMKRIKNYLFFLFITLSVAVNSPIGPKYSICLFLGSVLRRLQIYHFYIMNE